MKRSSMASLIHCPVSGLILLYRRLVPWITQTSTQPQTRHRDRTRSAATTSPKATHAATTTNKHGSLQHYQQFMNMLIHVNWWIPLYSSQTKRGGPTENTIDGKQLY